MDEDIATFTAITEASPEQAQRFLQLADGNLEASVQLFFNDPSLGSAGASVPPVPSRPANNEPITIDSDDDDDAPEAGSRNAPPSGIESDEEMARRLQQEMYGGAGGVGGAAFDEEGVRAPMARTTETLVGPGSSGPSWRDDPGQMNAAIAQQLFNRDRRNRAAPGIFNQRESPSIWNHVDTTDPAASAAALSRATGGASEQTAKSNLLANLFRPPIDLITPLGLSDARDEGKEQEKWLLVNVQDPSIFDCQVLNRDIWKNPQIVETIKEHFLFLQYNKDDPRGNDYVNYYFSSQRDNDAAYPHIAIIDPRTGEQVKTWSGAPSPKAPDFLMELHEFLDRYSLKMGQRNPVQKQRKESKKDVAAMSEEEMLEMALQNSLENGGGPSTDEDPDALTKSVENVNGKGKAPVADDDMEVYQPAKETPFSNILSSEPHEEPSSTCPETTRIQFRHSGGRVIRRFELRDPVRRIYEWLKAAPFEGKESQPFELVSMGQNLIERLDMPIGEAGLKNGTVMVEFVEE